jgi:hypothetical protein
MQSYASPVDEFDSPCGNGTVALIKSQFPVVKETPKGVWLDIGRGEKKFVLKQSKRQWASPSEEAAMEKFIRRKCRHVSILKAQIYDIERALALTGKVKENQDGTKEGAI